MKLSEVRSEIDSIIAREGDLDLGAVTEVSLWLNRIGWCNGWYKRVRSTGLNWSGGFIGKEWTATRIKGSYLHEPTDEELTPESMQEIRP